MVCLQFPQADAILKETLRLIPPGAIAARFIEQGHQLTPEVSSSSKQLCGLLTFAKPAVRDQIPHA